MRKSLSRRFFFCMHECSPSMSAAARLRFLGRGWGRGKNVRPMSGRGDIAKGNVQGVVARGAMIVPDCWLDPGRDDACSCPARIILRCPASCVECIETEQ
jgi:hypothetical protein